MQTAVAILPSTNRIGKERSRKLYQAFVLKGATEEYRAEFHSGTHEGRILGDDRFSEDALTRSEEKFRPEIQLDDVIKVVSNAYGIDEETLVRTGKTRPATEARAVAALLVQDIDNLTLVALGQYLRRKIATLSQSANRARERALKNREFREKIEMMLQHIYKH